MALENDIQELTAAVKALTAAISGATVKTSCGGGSGDPSEVKKEVKKTAPTPVAETKDAAPEPATESPSSEVTFEELAAKFTDLIEKDITKAKGLLATYNVPKLGGLSKDLYAEVFDKVTGLLNG